MNALVKALITFFIGLLIVIFMSIWIPNENSGLTFAVLYLASILVYSNQNK